jgi:hypothetical protein
VTVVTVTEGFDLVVAVDGGVWARSVVDFAGLDLGGDLGAVGGVGVDATVATSAIDSVVGTVVGEPTTSALEAPLWADPALGAGAAEAEEKLFGVTDCVLALLPMVMTVPIRIPKVMLRAEAVSAMPSPRRTALPCRV